MSVGLLPACGSGGGGGGGGTGPSLSVGTPSNVNATTLTSTQIQIGWTNTATNQTGFEIFRSLNGVDFVLAGTATASATHFTDIGLFPNTTYTYEMDAVSGGTHSFVSSTTQATTLQTSWGQLSPSGTPPSVRAGMSAINDLTTSQFLVYGGDDGSFPSNNKETFAMSLSGAGSPAWSSLASGPAVRIDYSFVYEPVGKQGILFGGYDGSTAQNTTWSLIPGTGWSVLPTAGTPPSARSGHSAVFLGTKMYVFGGQSMSAPPNNLLNDTYALDFSVVPPTWTQLTTAGFPPPGRLHHSAVADPGNTQMVVFGGQDKASDLNDTWILSLSGTATWIQITGTSGIPPSARYGALAIYSSVAMALILFGGETGTGACYNEVWMLTLTGTPTWKEVAPIGSPPGIRGRCAAIFDPVLDRMVIFGGENVSVFPVVAYNDTWSLDF